MGYREWRAWFSVCRLNLPPLIQGATDTHPQNRPGPRAGKAGMQSARGIFCMKGHGILEGSLPFECVVTASPADRGVNSLANAEGQLAIGASIIDVAAAVWCCIIFVKDHSLYPRMSLHPLVRPSFIERAIIQQYSTAMPYGGDENVQQSSRAGPWRRCGLLKYQTFSAGVALVTSDPNLARRRPPMQAKGMGISIFSECVA